MPTFTPELLVVLPIFNEEASIEKVIHEWMYALQQSGADFVCLAIDDGSRDQTLEKLHVLRAHYGERLEVLSRENRGHGQTCLQGYKMAIQRGSEFILQIDSDGQCDPQFFTEFWARRTAYDVIYGKRQREDGWRRVIASLVLRTALRLRCGVDCVDANVPYRLMRVSACRAAILSIPREFFLVNVALAVILQGRSDVRHGTVAIRFRARYGGEPSVPLLCFASKAKELFAQLKTLHHTDKGEMC